MSRAGAESTPEHSQRSEPSQRGGLILGAVIGVIAGVASSILSTLILLSVTPAVEARLQEPSCDDPRALSLVTGVEASSSGGALAPEKGQTFTVDNLLDGDTGTAWVEDVHDPKNAYGKGVRLTFNLPEKVDLQMICIVNGYGRSWPAYELNARLRLVNVETDRGDEEEVGLPEKSSNNYAEYQKLKCPKGETTRVVIKIETVRSGQGPKRAADTAVSEVELWRSD